MSLSPCLGPAACGAGPRCPSMVRRYRVVPPTAYLASACPRKGAVPRCPPPKDGTPHSGRKRSRTKVVQGRPVSFPADPSLPHNEHPRRTIVHSLRTLRSRPIVRRGRHVMRRPLQDRGAQVSRRRQRAISSRRAVRRREKKSTNGLDFGTVAPPLSSLSQPTGSRRQGPHCFPCLSVLPLRLSPLTARPAAALPAMSRGSPPMTGRYYKLSLPSV